MAVPENESIQESLDRLNKAQSKATGSPAPAGPTLVRDAKVLNTLNEVRGWSMLPLFILLALSWTSSPPETDLAWLYIPVSIGAWTFGASFLVSSTAMELLLILNPGRYRQAWAQISPTDSPVTDRTPLDRDAIALLRIRRVFAWSGSTGLLLLLFWFASPAGTDLVWLRIPVSIGAWTCGASFFVSTAAIVLLFILDPGRYRRARGQIVATGSPVLARPPRDRDARVLFWIVGVCAWSMIAGLFLWLPLAVWSFSPSGAALVWLDMLVSVVAWTLGTSFLVSTAAIVLLFILNPRRYWRAWVQIRNPNPNAF